ncbi:MAG TPA: META domain-containing protein [Longimicrobium sp.]|nr:META domain-containing protein [Longimicrobium sp.]
MRPQVSSLIAVLAPLLAAACGAGPDPRAASSSAPPGASGGERTVTAERLPGTEWMLVSTNGTRPLPMPPLTVMFDDTTFGGYGGCNWFGGRYTAGGDTLRLREISSTARGCSPPIADQEARFIRALGDAWTVHQSADSLRLHAGGGVVLEFVRRRLRAMDPAQLQGTRWRLVSIGNRPAESLRATLSFTRDSLRGFAGCRDFTGTYHAVGHRIGVTSLAMRQMECADDRLLREEGDFTTALSESRDFQIERSSLLLLPVSGEVLRFEREPAPSTPLN